MHEPRQTSSEAPVTFKYILLSAPRYKDYVHTFFSTEEANPLAGNPSTREMGYQRCNGALPIADVSYVAPEVPSKLFTI